MSVSKLESLPNEILIEILEKYINAIDIIKAFAFQLNQRFDALIAQSQGLRFDFIRCHKDDFRFCMGLLPAYFDKTQELALAERYTPGQTHAFFSFYPSFGVFKHLRKLYLHIDMDAGEVTLFENALCSLSTTTLHTLSLQISPVRTLNSLDKIIVEIFRIKTLKKLLISCDSFRMNWGLLKEVSSNIEYLTLYDVVCQCGDLGHIFRCTSSLRYLDIYLQLVLFSHSYQLTSSSTEPLPQMSMLHTAIFNIRVNDKSTVNYLAMYFKCMPSLHHLEIKTQYRLLSITEWERLIQSALPLLTSFTLEIIKYQLTEEDVSNALAGTETPFWTKKQRFHLFIQELARSNSNQFCPEVAGNADRHEWKKRINRWYIGPLRKLNDNSSVLNRISKLRLPTESHSLTENPYLNNVTDLIIDELNENLLDLITTHINCTQIKHLDVASIKDENNKISSLLSYTTNIRSLRIALNELHNERLSFMRKYDNVHFLDISADQHSFDARDISVISSLFPYLEHLIIYTKDLQNVPLLETSLHHLRSLTFGGNKLNRSDPFDDYDEKMFDHALRERAEFLLRHKGKWITVWIDQAALQDLYWCKFDSVC